MTTHYSSPPRNQVPGAGGGRSTPLWSAILMSLVSAVIGGIIAVSLVSTGDPQAERRQQEQLDGLSNLTVELLGDVAGLRTQIDGSGLSGYLTRPRADRIEAPYGCSGRPAVWSGFGTGLEC